MKQLIIYDSFFGNTKEVADAIYKAMGKEAKAVHVNDAKSSDLKGISLLVVGSPTRAFRPSPAIKGFLNSIPAKHLQGIDVAAFDTRISTADTNSRFLNLMVKIFGYAAKPISKKLVSKGGNLIASPEGFYVKDTKGPLKDAELERAKSWAHSLMKKK